MLVLTIAKQQPLVAHAFDADGQPVRIEFAVLAHRGDKTKVGVTAPVSIKVYRGEVQAEIDAETIS